MFAGSTETTGTDERFDEQRNDPIVVSSSRRPNEAAIRWMPDQRRPRRRAEESAHNVRRSAPSSKRWLLAIVRAGQLLRLGWLSYANAEPPALAAIRRPVQLLVLRPRDRRWTRVQHAHPHADGVLPDRLPVDPRRALLDCRAHPRDRRPDGGCRSVPRCGVSRHRLAHVRHCAATVRRRQSVSSPRGSWPVCPNLVYQVTSLQLETTFVFLTVAALRDHRRPRLVDGHAEPPPAVRVRCRAGAVGALVRPFSLPLSSGCCSPCSPSVVGWRRCS